MKSKAKELIIDSGIDFKTVLLCEILFLNFLDWRVFIFSSSEVVYSVFNYLGLPKNAMEALEENIVNSVNFAMSEISLYTQFDWTVISLAVCKMVLGQACKVENPYLKALENLVRELKLEWEVSECFVVINEMLDQPEEEPSSNIIELLVLQDSTNVLF